MEKLCSHAVCVRNMNHNLFLNFFKVHTLKKKLWTLMTHISLRLSPSQLSEKIRNQFVVMQSWWSITVRSRTSAKAVSAGFLMIAVEERGRCSFCWPYLYEFYACKHYECVHVSPTLPLKGKKREYISKCKFQCFKYLAIILSLTWNITHVLTGMIFH